MQLKYEQEYYRIQDIIKANNKRSIKGSSLNLLLKDIINSNVSLNYSTKRPYSVGCVCVYADSIYVCTTATSGVFDAGDWQELVFTPPINSNVADWLARGGTGDASLISAYTQLALDLDPIRVTNGKRLRLNMFADSAFANIFVPFLADLGPDTDTNNNFVSGDYGLTTGLQGNNATKFIDSGTNPTTDWLASNNGTLGLWNYTAGGALEFEMGCSISGAKYTSLGVNVVGNTYHCININTYATLPVGTDTGFILATRNSDNDNKLYNGSTLVNTFNTVDISTPNENITVFRQPLGFFSGRRLGCYLIADGLSAAEVTTLYNALVTFNTAIGR